VKHCMHFFLMPAVKPYLVADFNFFPSDNFQLLHSVIVDRVNHVNNTDFILLASNSFNCCAAYPSMGSIRKAPHCLSSQCHDDWRQGHAAMHSRVVIPSSVTDFIFFPSNSLNCRTAYSSINFFPSKDLFSAAQRTRRFDRYVQHLTAFPL
jgi:hypothetical protein